MVFIVAFLIVATYNAIVALRQRIDKAWANIEVVLKQRHDELPNVVAAVRDVMAYEQSCSRRSPGCAPPGRPTSPSASRR